MNIIIVEDEMPAFQRLHRMLQKEVSDLNLLAHLDTVEDTVDWLENNPSPELIFLDIQLADGLSTEIFKQTEVKTPVIFTTAYDQYAVQAFRLNSLDYLLKPIVQEQVREALDRFQNLPPNQVNLPDYQGLLSLIHDLKDEKSYRKRFLVKIGDQYKYISSEEICWMAADSGYISVRTQNGDRHLLDKSLEQITSELNPMDFFQISRGCLVAMAAIQRIHSYFNSRLRLELRHGEKGEFIVSRDRVKEFKAWLDQ